MRIILMLRLDKCDEKLFDKVGKRFCRKVRFLGKIQKSSIMNSMTYRLPNSRKSHFATEPRETRLKKGLVEHHPSSGRALQHRIGHAGCGSRVVCSRRFPGQGACLSLSQASVPRLQRPSLPSSPRPHDGAIPVQTRDMERGLLLVREGHRDGVAMHRVGAPRAWADRVLPPPPRTFGLRQASALYALRFGRDIHTPSAEKYWTAI